MKDNYVNTAFKIPYTTLQEVEKMAYEYGLSRGNMLMKLVEWAVIAYGGRVEVSSVTPEGRRNKKQIPSVLNNGVRKKL